jgi:hypothetical protein
VCKAWSVILWNESGNSCDVRENREKEELKMKEETHKWRQNKT